MFKIMVVDDFLSDRESITAAVKTFCDLDVIVAGDCENGEVALEMLYEVEPDIIICDVEMPFMDGFTFAKAARERIPNLRFIFCSLYDKFLYVQTTLKLGGDGYLLKPLVAEELRECLIQVINELSDKNRRSQDYGRLLEFVAHNKPMLIEMFYTDLIYGHIRADEAAQKGCMLDLDLTDGVFGLAVAEVDDFRETSERLEYSSGTMLSLIVQRELKHALNSYHNIWVLRMDDSHYTMVFHMAPEDIPAPSSVAVQGKSLQKMLTICDGLVSCFRMQDISVTIALADPADNILSLNACYEQCLHQLKYKILLGKQRTIFSSSIPNQTNKIEIDLNGMRKDLMFLLNSGETDRISDYVNMLFSHCHESSDSNFPRTLSFCLMNCLQLVLNEANENLSCLFDDERAIWNKLLRFETIVDISRMFKNILTVAADFLQTRHNNKKSGFIEKVCRYIEDSDPASLCLESIAAAFYYSPNHLSRIFKEETGGTILEYLTSCRMERAKKMLEDTPKRLHDIATELGYSHATYFITVFKKYYGLTPREFRELQEGG